MLPEHPGHKKRDGFEGLPMRRRRELFRAQPPLRDRVLLIGDLDRNNQPIKDNVPGLTCKGAGQQQVLDSFHGLVAKEASRVMLQATSREPLSSPAAILVGEPMEKFYPWRRPTLPYQLPRMAPRGSLETGRIT